MIRFFKKQRLAARGLSCGKTRRAPSESNMLSGLEESLFLRIGTIFIIGAVLASFCFIGDPPEPLRHILYALLILLFAVIQPIIRGNDVLKRNSRFVLFFALILMQLGIGEFLKFQVEMGHVMPSFLPLIIPYALAPLTLSVLLGAETALAACVVGALWWSVIQQDLDPMALLLTLTGGLVAVLSTLRVRRRSRLLRAGFYSSLSVWLLALLSGVIGPIIWEAPMNNDWWQLGLESAAMLSVGVITAVLVSGSLPLLEQFFGITTEISWLEMADLNHPLLRRLSMEAPGSYHHSLAMANLAEACAEKIGANPTLCRVSAYFHDIGKLLKPDYFTENMPSGENPHDELTPTMSALIILSHVKEGVDLALRNKLNCRIIDAIQQHHGTTLVEYFYQRACRQEQDARVGGRLMNVRSEDIPKVSEENFRYAGPKPQTIEAVILGLADAAESASRSLERPTRQRLDDLIRNILRDRIQDCQYNEAPVTMAQLQEIGATLVSCLASMHHSRITYRKRDEKLAVMQVS
jgi:hypothetical protein